MRVTRIFFATILVVALSSTWSKAQEKGARADILEIPMVPSGAGARSGFLGVGAEELTAEEVEKLGIAGGLRLTEVENDSPANKAEPRRTIGKGKNFNKCRRKSNNKFYNKNFSIC